MVYDRLLLLGFGGLGMGMGEMYYGERKLKIDFWW